MYMNELMCKRCGSKMWWCSIAEVDINDAGTGELRLLGTCEGCCTRFDGLLSRTVGQIKESDIN